MVASLSFIDQSLQRFVSQIVVTPLPSGEKSVLDVFVRLHVAPQHSLQVPVLRLQHPAKSVDIDNYLSECQFDVIAVVHQMTEGSILTIPKLRVGPQQFNVGGVKICKY